MSEGLMPWAFSSHTREASILRRTALVDARRLRLGDALQLALAPEVGQHVNVLAWLAVEDCEKSHRPRADWTGTVFLAQAHCGLVTYAADRLRIRATCEGCQHPIPAGVGTP